MKKVEIKGIIPPIITPMNEDETINETELRNQVNRQIRGGVHGLFPFGTNGEGYILSEAEKEQVLSIVIDETKVRSMREPGASAQRIQSASPGWPRPWARMCSPSSHRHLQRPPRMSCMSTTARWQRQWICPLSSTIYRQGPAMPLRLQRLPV